MLSKLFAVPLGAASASGARCLPVLLALLFALPVAFLPPVLPVLPAETAAMAPVLPVRMTGSFLESERASSAVFPAALTPSVTLPTKFEAAGAASVAGAAPSSQANVSSESTLVSGALGAELISGAALVSETG